MPKKIDNSNKIANVIEAAKHVYDYFGYGFLENVYQDALDIEFSNRRIQHIREKNFLVYYENRKELPSTFRPDFLCYDNIIVEVKATYHKKSFAVNQVRNYIKVAHITDKKKLTQVFYYPFLIRTNLNMEFTS